MDGGFELLMHTQCAASQPWRWFASRQLTGNSKSVPSQIAAGRDNRSETALPSRIRGHINVSKRTPTMANETLSIAAVALVAGLAACAKSGPTVEPAATANPKHEREHAHGEHAHGERAAEGHHGAMHHRFEDADAWAKAFDDPERDTWQKPEAVLTKLALPQDAAVADIGAGTGYFTVRLARQVSSGTVIAADIEPDMVRYLGERATKESLSNITAVQSATDDPALPSPVDLIFICDTLHHMANRTEYFRRAAASLRPGGRVAIVDFSPDAPDDAPGPPKKHRLAASTVVQELSAAGYTHVETDRELLPYQYIVIMAAPTAG